MGVTQDVCSADEFQSFAAANDLVAAYFWAQWSEPSRLLQEAVDEVLSANSKLSCAKVDVDQVPAVCKHLGVSSVPTVVFLRKGDAISTVEGFEPATLFEKADEVVAQAADNGDLNSTLKRLTTQQPVMLFMKGTPATPRCGFSRRVVEALQSAGISFGHFDILSNDEVRQGLKAYSDWPTYPQLYGDGELIGGCDIILELANTGELKGAVPAAAVEGGGLGNAPLEQRIRTLLGSAPVMLLMKGSPDEPRCGFSRRVVEALQTTGIDFKAFDILQDEEIRQGVKAFSDWPTYPQLYVNSELLGGCDIIMELAGKDELGSAIQECLQQE
eukprot:jgi/Ulvmu1/5217/UM022_0010.1